MSIREAAPVDPAECYPGTIQILHLQDLTESFTPMRDDLIANMDELLDPLAGSYPGLEYAIAGFQDKSLPFFGSNLHVGDYDPTVCYELVQGMTSELVDLGATLEGMAVSSGGDESENQLGALMNSVLDPAVGWDEEKPKFIIIFTDSMPHGFDVDEVFENRPNAAIGEGPEYFNGKEDLAAMARGFESSYSRQMGLSEETEDSFHWLMKRDCETGYLDRTGGMMDDSGNEQEKYGVTRSNILSTTQKEQWDNAVAGCQPQSIFLHGGRWEEIPHSVNDALLLSDTHFPEWPTEFVEEQDCSKFEYPSFTETFLHLHESGFIPLIVLLSPDGTSIGYESNEANWGCDRPADGWTIEADLDCKAQLYREALTHVLGPDAAFEVTPMEGADLSVIADIILDFVGDHIVTCPPFVTTTENPDIPTPPDKNVPVIIGSAAGVVALIGGCIWAYLQSGVVVKDKYTRQGSGDVCLQMLADDREQFAEVEESQFR